MYPAFSDLHLRHFTNTGILNTLAVPKNWIVQLGVVVGTETMPWNIGATMPNPNPNPLYPGATMLRDPGAQPSRVEHVHINSGGQAVIGNVKKYRYA
jgi:hypothetical protein